MGEKTITLMAKKTILPMAIALLLSAFSMSAWATPPTSEHGIGYIQNWTWSCDGSQTVTIKFTLPDRGYVENVSYKGETEQWSIALRTANRTYTTLESGTALGGDTITRTFTISQFNNQRVYFNVTAGVSSSDTKTIERSVWVGGGKPKSPQNANVTVDDNNLAHITWEAPEAGSEDLAQGQQAYVNLDSITYKVRRFPDGTYIADDLDGLEFFDQLPSGAYQTYYYEVYSKFRGMTTTHPSTTKRVGAGAPYEVPYFEDFSTSNNKDLFITYDGNGDNRTWYISQVGGMAVNYSINGKDGNDWLISPPIHLLKGNVYKFSSSFLNDINGGKANVEVFISQHSDSTALRSDNIRLLSTNVDKRVWESHSKDFSVPESGNYRIAFHDISKRSGNFYQLAVDSIAIDVVSRLEAPDSVTSLTTVRGEKGEQTVDISFIAPSKSTDGAQLADLDSITVVRDNDNAAIANLATVEPGKAYTVRDSKALNTRNTYIIYAYNSAGRGRGAKVTSQFVGIDVPKAPTVARLHDNGDDTYTLTWNHVGTVGENGGYVDTTKVIYAVYVNRDSTKAVLDSTTATTYTRKVTAIQPDEQDLFKMRVVARNPQGTSHETSSNMVVIGNSYPMPVHESWSSATDYLWWFSYEGVDGTSSPWLRTKSAADHDGYCMAIQFFNTGDAAQLNSGKISLVDVNHPILDYWYYNQPGTKGNLVVRIDLASKGFVTVDSIDYSKSTGWSMQWKHRVIDLKPFLTNEKYFMLSFRPVAGADYSSNTESKSPIFAIDDITIRDQKDYDLSATITAPAAAKVSQSAAFDVTVQNLGAKTASGYTIDLYVNGEKADTQNGTDIAGNGLADKTFRLRYTPTAADTVLTAYAVVNYAADEVTSNNTTETVTAKVDNALLAAINDLTAAPSGEKVTLNWTAPAKDKAVFVTDDFESYHPWDLRGFGDWKVVDADGRPTHESALEYWPGSGLPFAFQIYSQKDVYERSSNDHGDLGTPHSGSQMVFNMGMPNNVSGANDDWLITPELSGNAQKITFWVNSFNTQGSKGAKIAILTSKTGTDISDFTALPGDTVTVLTEGWQLFTADEASIVEGTKYVAVHVMSDHEFSLFFDDFTYQPAIKHIKGYNIYEDGKLVGTTDGATTFTLTTDGSGHKFNVTVIYDNGESSFSNTALVATGISSVVSDGTLDTDAPLYNIAGQRVSKSYKGVVIQNGKKFIRK